MANQDDMQDQIEEFVLGEMSERDAEAFALKVEADAGLAAAVADFRSLRADMLVMDEANFMGRMKEMAGEMKMDAPLDNNDARLLSNSSPRASFLRRRWPYAVAAALLLLLIPALMLLRGGDEALFTEYFSPYSDVTTARGSDDSAFLAAMEAYNSGDYGAALPHFAAFLRRSPADQDGLFYGGIAEAAAGSPAIAVQRLQQLRSQESIFQIAATWYQALAHLKAGARDRARALLAQLAATDNSFQARAQALLEAL